MTKPKLIYGKTSINIKGLEEDIKKLVEKGYTLRGIFEVGLKVLSTQDETVKSMLEAKNEIIELKREITHIRELIQTIIQLNPTIVTVKSELNNTIANIDKVNIEVNTFSQGLKESLKRLSDIETDLKKLVDKYKVAFIEELLSELNDLDRLRLSLMQTFNIPNDYKDAQEMVLKIAKLKRIVAQFRDSTLT